MASTTQRLFFASALCCTIVVVLHMMKIEVPHHQVSVVLAPDSWDNGHMMRTCSTNWMPASQVHVLRVHEIFIIGEFSIEW